MTEKVDEKEAYAESRKYEITTNLLSHEYSNLDSSEFTKYFSQYSKIVRMIAWMLRFYEISHKKTGRNVSELTFEEYEAAEIRLIRIVQSECFNKKGEYINMQIFQDEKGLLELEPN
ncbi:hypothetical protein JTB14_003827 [Gonioctena quinquepunctata]|nr:hypothetical protein JTB14_003827 [Gonioctena quinquepunctata]